MFTFPRGRQVFASRIAPAISPAVAFLPIVPAGVTGSEGAQSAPTAQHCRSRHKLHKSWGLRPQLKFGTGTGVGRHPLGVPHANPRELRLQPVRLYELLKQDDLRRALFVVLPTSLLAGFWFGRYFPKYVPHVAPRPSEPDPRVAELEAIIDDLKRHPER